MATQRLKKGQLPEMAANSVRVRNANDAGDGSDIALTTAQILIGNGNGFTAAALSGDVTMANTGAVTIAATSVERSMIADDAIDSTKLADDAVNSEHYVDGSIDLVHMSANSVDSDQYVDGSIDLVHMSANSVDSDQYVDASIDTAHIAASQITNALMAANSIDSDQYIDGSIDLVHMSANSVDSDQYVDGSVDNVHLANSVVSIGAQTVTLGAAATTAFTGLTGLDFTAADASIASNLGANTLTLGAGNSTVSIAGNLQVQGATTTVNTATMQVEDINIELALGAANDAAADGGGITIKSGDGDKLFRWLNAGDRFSTNQNVDVDTGMVYKVNNAEVLSANGAVKVQSGVAGLGLVHNAGALDLNPDDSSLELNGDELRIKALGVVNGSLAANAVTEDKIADSAVQKEHFHSDCFGPGLKADAGDNSIRLNIIREYFPGSQAATDQDLVDSSSNAIQTKAFGQLQASAVLAAGTGGAADQPEPGNFLQVFVNGLLQEVEVTNTASDKGNDRLKNNLIDCLLDVTGRRIHFKDGDIDDSDSVQILYMAD
tara:strand:+ start:9321 stop:10967 length:1647 start_codon:yes stop_codon:yes gene_type:complete